MSNESTQSRIDELEREVSSLEEEIGDLEEEIAELECYRINSEQALSSYRSRRFVAMLDDLEKMLPSDFVGLADDIPKWAGKTR